MRLNRLAGYKGLFPTPKRAPHFQLNLCLNTTASPALVREAMGDAMQRCRRDTATCWCPWCGEDVTVYRPMELLVEQYIGNALRCSVCCKPVHLEFEPDKDGGSWWMEKRDAERRPRE